MGKRNLNTTLSHLFRAAVGAHFAFLFVLIFVLKNTLAGTPRHVVTVILSILMIAIAVVFVADMATRRDEGREHSKLIDGILGFLWFALVGFLLMNSLRAGAW